MFHVRDRSICDPSHLIRNPLGPAPAMLGWANTMAQTRIAELFRTVSGLEGHARQIQQEINRLSKVEGCSGAVVAQAIRVTAFIRHSLLQAHRDAQARGFPHVGDVSIHFPLLNDSIQF